MNVHEQELIGDAIAAENVRLLLTGKLKGRAEPGTLARGVQLRVQSLLQGPEPAKADLLQHLRGRASVATEGDHATQLTGEQWEAVKLARRGLLI